MEYELQAYPGRAIIAMHNRYGDFEGDVYIPKNAPSKISVGRMGMVVSITMFPEHQDSLVYVKGVLVPRPMWLYNDHYASLFEQYVLCKNARLIYDQLYDVRLEFVQSVVPEDAMPSEDELGRCRQCKSDGEANILLGPDGFCPNCGFNNQGIHESEDAIQVEEADIDFISRIPNEIEHCMRTGGKAVSGRVISYPGQRNRGGNVMANNHELNEFMKNYKGKS